MSKPTHQQLVAELQNHVIEFADHFNKASEATGLGITLDPTNVVNYFNGLLSGRLTHMLHQMREHGVHKEQVITAVNAIAQTIKRPGRSGIVLGALQSGKTGTAFMTLFAAPVHYLKSKVAYVPLFMTTNQNSHMEQTQSAMRAFFDLYGEIKIISDGKSNSLIDYYADQGTELSAAEDVNETTLQDYTATVAQELYPGADPVHAIVQGMTVKRVTSDISNRVRSFCNRARDQGRAVMLIVDEPQFGASNRITKAGKETICLLSRALKEIDAEFFSKTTANFMIGLSATPFDTYGLKNLWKVRQKLNAHYVGLNLFGGQKIDPSVETTGPEVVSFSELAKMNKKLADFAEIPYLIGTARKPLNKSFKPTSKDENGKKIPMKIVEKKQKGADLIRATLDTLLKKRQNRFGNGHGPIGALLRIANDNDLTEEILDAMGMNSPDFPYNIIRFNSKAGEVKQLIRQATQNDPRPYLVIAVGKGRMGDAFPPSTVMGIDLSRAATDANSFLQGVYGRMCGYGKLNPIVIVSDATKELYNEYVLRKGKATKSTIHMKSEKLTPGKNQHESFFMLTNEMIDADHADSPLRGFRAEIIAYLAEKNVSAATQNHTVPQRAQLMNMPELMRKYNIIEYLAENSMRLDPNLTDPARIVPFGEPGEVRRRNGEIEEINYAMKGDDHCRVLVNKVDYAYAKEAFETGRGTLKTQSPAKHLNRGRRHEHILPVIAVKKVDETQAPIPLDEYGSFVFDGLVFHLESNVLRFVPDQTRDTLVEGHFASAAMTNQEKADGLANYVLGRMKGRGNPTFEDAVGEPEIIRLMTDRNHIYDSSTHTFYLEDKKIVFLNKETGENENPNGPASIDMSDPKNIVIDEFDGTEYDEDTDYVDEDEDDVNEEQVDDLEDEDDLEEDRTRRFAMA